jgi:hypothetical protein
MTSIRRAAGCMDLVRLEAASLRLRRGQLLFITFLRRGSTASMREYMSPVAH